MTKKILKYIVLIAILSVVGFLVFGRGVTETISETENEASVVQSFEEQSEETITTNTNQTINNDMQNPIAIVQTNFGSIEIELFSDLAPQTVENFVTLSQNNFYDGVRFHRVIEGFMIQSGDPLSKDSELVDRWGTGGPGYTFSDEIHEGNNNILGTISMANAGPNTNGSQFFINVADNTYLDDKHTVFGKVISGYNDVVEKISLVETLPGVNRPIEDVIITSITIK